MSRYQELETEVVVHDVVDGIPRSAVAKRQIREGCAMVWVCCLKKEDLVVGRRNLCCFIMYLVVCT
jgi:hypothetical protein